MPKSIKTETSDKTTASDKTGPRVSKSKKSGVTKPTPTATTTPDKKKKTTKKNPSSSEAMNATKEWSKLGPKQKDEMHVLITQKVDIGYIIQALKDMQKDNSNRVEARKPKQFAAVSASTKT